MFRTRGEDPRLGITGGTTDLKVQMSPPGGLAATQIAVDYGDNPVTFGSTATAQCSGKCEATISISPDSIVYVRPRWLNAQGQVLATGSVKVFAAP